MSRRKKTTEDFIHEARKLHGNKYDYSKTLYSGVADKILISCLEHGEFEQVANKHLRGQGCPICALDSKRKTGDQFIREAQKLHGNKYDYSKVLYKNSSSKILIVCPKHGEFKQGAQNHLRGHGCPACFFDTQRKSKVQFIKEAKQIHGTKYDYSKVIYKNNDSKVIITCPEHGDFEQYVSSHLQGSGCSLCSYDIQRKSKGQFIKEARKIHGSKYDYSKVNYTTNGSRVVIKCKEHGEFEQTPGDHLRGRGCRSCIIPESKPQKEIQAYIESLGVEVKSEVKIAYNLYDIVDPERKIIVEYNGLWYHSSARLFNRAYHKGKRIRANKLGYRVIQIWGDEWSLRKEKIQNYLKDIFTKDAISIGARKLEIKSISHIRATSFQNKHHIQGACNSKGGSHLGLYLKKRLIAQVSFYSRKDQIEIRRYTVRTGYKIPGGFQRLLSTYRKEDDRPLITFCDLDKFEGNIYERAGFKRVKTTLNLTYTDHRIRYPRRQFMKKILLKRWPDSDLTKTEKEICEEHGYYQVWNSGIRKYILE